MLNVVKFDAVNFSFQLADNTTLWDHIWVFGVEPLHRLLNDEVRIVAVNEELDSRGGRNAEPVKEGFIFFHIAGVGNCIYMTNSSYHCMVR